MSGCMLFLWENVEFDAASLRLLAKYAKGSMRDALSLTDQAIAYGSGTIEEAAVKQMLGSVGRSHIYELIQAIAQGRGNVVVDLVNQMRMQSLPAKAALEEMVDVLQRMAILRVAPQTALADDPDDAQITALIPLLKPDEVQLLYSIVLQGQNELGLASDEYAAIVMVLLRMLAFIPSDKASGQSDSTSSSAEKKTELGASLEPVIREATQPTATSIKEAKAFSAAGQNSSESAPATQKISSTPTVAPDSKPKQVFEASPSWPEDDDLPPWVSESIPVAEPEISSSQSSANFLSSSAPEPNQSKSPNQLPATGNEFLLPEATLQTSRWEEIVQHLINNDLVVALTRELAMNAQVKTISQDEKEWHFQCSRKTLLTDANQEKLATAMQTLLEHPVRLSFEFGDVIDTPALRIQALNQQRQKEAEAAVAADPDIQKWLHTYTGAKIVPGSTRTT